MCVPPSSERVGCRFTSWCGLDLDRPMSYVGMKGIKSYLCKNTTRNLSVMDHNANNEAVGPFE